MTSDEKIRAILDERGIDYQIYDGSSRICFYFDYSEQCGDFLKSIDVIGACVIASQSYLTPEQAIAATVGVGTCNLVDNDSGPDMHCTACGGGVDDEYRYFMDSWGYSRCPHCGARIIEWETE